MKKDKTLSAKTPGADGINCDGFDHDGIDREGFSSLSFRQKVQWIWDYEKLPLFGILLALFVIVSLSHHALTAPHEILRVAVINTGLGDQSKEFLTDSYLSTLSSRSGRDSISLDASFVLTDNKDSAAYEYAYASSIKLLAAITDKDLDVVLMDETGADIMKKNGYLMDLTGDFPASDDGVTLSLDQTKFAEAAGFSGDVRCGIIMNTKRKEQAVHYLHYLLGD
jgi:hypothetical protein